MAVVAEFLAEVKGFLVGHGQQFAVVPASLEDGSDKLFVLSGQAADEYRDLVALFGGKRPFGRTPVLRCLLAIESAGSIRSSCSKSK